MDKIFDVFISHSSLDKKLGYGICRHLEERKLKCWIAPRDVNKSAGKDYAESIIEGIRSSAIMIIVLNKNANESTFVKKEVERASHYKLILLPFKTDDSIPDLSLELYLSSIHWLDASDSDPEDYFDELYENCALRLGRSMEPREIFTDKKPVTVDKPTTERSMGRESNNLGFEVKKPPVEVKVEEKPVLITDNATVDKKTPVGLRIFLFGVLSVPQLIGIPFFFYVLYILFRDFDMIGVGLLIWLLFCAVVGYLGIVEFIKRFYVKIKPIRQLTAVVSARSQCFNPFYLDKTDRNNIILNCCLLSLTPLLLLISLYGNLGVKSGLVNYLIFSGLAVFLIQYALFAFSLFSKTPPAKYKIVNFLIAAAYLIFFIIAIRYNSAPSFLSASILPHFWH